MPAGLVVTQMLHLGGQLAEAVDQSGQRNGHHDEGGNGAGDYGRVIHSVILGLGLSRPRPLYLRRQLWRGL